MKKILCALLVMSVIALGMAQASAACSRADSAIKTGSACSLAELNNLETNKKTQVNGVFPRLESDLRPVKLAPEKQKTSDVTDGCLFGMCLIKQVLGK